KQGRPDSLRIERANGRVTVVARDATLADVLTALAESEKLNLVLAAPAGDKVTVTLTNCTLPDALTALLTSAGYNWTIRNDVVYVTSLSGAVTSPDVQGRRLRAFELDYASATDVSQAVTGLLSPVGKSWISQKSPTDNRRTKEVVTVEDLPAYIDRIEDYIAQIDQPPRQVLIEVHVLQIKLSDDDRHGVDLSHVASLGGLKLDMHTAGLANAAAPQAFFVQATAPNLKGLIEALKTTTDAKTLASPRIIAVNGQQAHIQVGEQLGFRVTTTTETSTLESVEFLNVGVVLTVTPHIARDGRVLLRIRPEVSSGSVSPTTGLPEEETTEVQTDVLLATGQGMVIGGLIQEVDDISANKYLGLGDARWIGPLFQRRQEVKSRSEIIVALVPHILPLPPAEKCRNDVEFARVREPLMVGPLCRYPRPYEPRLPDCRLNPRRPCDPHPCDYGWGCGAAGCDGFGADAGLYRLPAVEDWAPQEVEFDGPIIQPAEPGPVVGPPVAPHAEVSRATTNSLRLPRFAQQWFQRR
ncbi:MAG: type II secretion system protein GspD, partial [Planctomycetales bacterium]|nr:type II secretion system protein GspD [Planctomycetales bacterium]